MILGVPVLYVITIPWFYGFSFTGASIVGNIVENTVTKTNFDMSRIIYGYKAGLFIGGAFGGITLGSVLGLFCTGIIRELLGKKTWLRGIHNFWGVFTGLSIGVIYSIVFVNIFVISAEITPLGRYLTQDQVQKRVGIFCLPTNLPANVNPTPIFYKSGDPSIPDVTVLYRNAETSDREFIIILDDVSGASMIQVYGEYDRFNPTQYCQNEVALSNEVEACYTDLSTQPALLRNEVIIEGLPFETNLQWQMRKNKKVTIYSILSSLSLDETKAIAASICLE